MKYKANMGFELDHLFIMTDIGAPIADRLISCGLTEGRSNTHPGQGTANRCFFFHNAMLELLWVHDPVEAQSEIIYPTRLWERWESRNDGKVCPVGICLRPSRNSEETSAFASWSYRPPYLPADMDSIAIGNNSDVLTEPLLFQTPFAKRPDQYLSEKSRSTLEHQNAWREITRVELVSPAANNLSPEMQAAINTDQIELRLGTEYCVNLGFDGERQHQQLDFRPDLPLIVNW
jgi:hypothetical protein